MSNSRGADGSRLPKNEIERLKSENRRLVAKLNKKADLIDELRQQVQQAQKMETLGTLVAGVAHEINNPINLIIYNLPLLKKVWEDFQPILQVAQESDPERKYGGFSYDFLKENLNQLIADMELAANRVTKIVADLKNFSRQSKHPCPSIGQ